MATRQSDLLLLYTSTCSLAHTHLQLIDYQREAAAARKDRANISTLESEVGNASYATRTYIGAIDANFVLIEYDVLSSEP